VAASIVRGIEKQRFLIAADMQTKLLSRVAGLVPGALHSTFDRQVRKAQRRAGRG
jgi:hypothetical protein